MTRYATLCAPAWPNPEGEHITITNTPGNVFQDYADSYDALYSDKDYETECDYLERLFRRFGQRDVHSVLDLGCGTGGHALPLSRRGFEVVGIDRSPQMVAIARQKAQSEQSTTTPRFEVADIQSVQLSTTFDAVICMFAVLGYQTTNDGLLATLSNARLHMKPRGLFICDFWYGPAVLRQQPNNEVKIVTDGDARIIRITRPELNVNTNVVQVAFHMLRLQADQLIQETEEIHSVRYLFLPEIEFLMAQAGLELVDCCPFGEMDQGTSEATWKVTAIARAK